MSNDIEELLPHRPPMLWVDTFLECIEDEAVASARIDPGHYAVRDGYLLETALVELAAQTVALALGHRRRGNDGGGISNQGMLIGVTSFKILAAVPVGSTLDIHTREVKRLGPMLLVAVTISCSGELVASGELSLYA